ncbi:MAG: hypothetical protein KDC48_22820, partial [Planctomycetes bacterium]|nr:hypothetical protein [Planctomycetota bacterium]
MLDSSPAEAIGPSAEVTDFGPLGPGRTLTSVEYDFLHRRDLGVTEREQGVGMRWSRETLDWGYLSAEIAGRLEDDGRGLDDEHGSGRFSFQQEDFVLAGELLSDTLLGDQIAVSNPLVSRSFRYNLPSTYMRGIGVRLHDQRQELRVQAGRVGNLAGERLLTYEPGEETLGGIGYRRDFDQRLSAALQVWSLTGVPGDADHGSAAGALEFRPDATQSYQVHTLSDTGGRHGLWLDGDLATAAWRHRYGLFRIEPGLKWLDDSIANDREGAYWRSDLRASRYSLTGGLDVSESNIDADPGLAGAVTASGFLRGTWLARR